MPLFRGSKNATIANGEIVATAQDIVDAVNDAIAAKNAAEASESGAQTAETNAETAETNAETAEANAETAESGAVDAQSYAEEWANKSEDSLVSGAAGGDGVDDYSALHHANKASDSASAASTSESNALTSEQNAQQAATDAETALDTFTDQYLGAKSSDPDTDNDGDPLVTGALYFDTTLDELRVYDGSQWLSTNYNSADVNITGGSIDGTSVGLTTPGTGVFTDFTASGTAEFTSTGAVILPSGTEGERPTPQAAMLRFNADLSEFEGYNGTEWASVGGSAINDDTTTTSELFPLFVDATSGTALDVFVSDGNLGYTPSTGEFKAEELNAGNGLIVNSATVSSDYSIPTGSNAMSTGPIEVADGVTVTVPDGSRWVVI